MNFPKNQLAGLMYYMKEREIIRLRKESGKPWPWTADPILQTYKFTNVKRAHDRTTRAFVKFYRKHYKRDDTSLLYNCGIARYFGTEIFQQSVGWNPSRALLVSTAAVLMRQGTKVFTGAYVTSTGGKTGAKAKVVAKYVSDLDRAAPRIITAMQQHRSWQAGYDLMQDIDGFGGSGFMVKEVLQDFLLVTKLRIDDRMTWTPMGPGARRGMNRLMEREVRYRQPERFFITEVQALHRQLQPWWEDTFPQHCATGEEPLSAHDVQFCLCEFDKYSRVASGSRPRTLYKGAPQ